MQGLKGVSLGARPGFYPHLAFGFRLQPFTGLSQDCSSKLWVRLMPDALQFSPVLFPPT